MKMFIFAHAGGNVWEYKNLFSKLRDIAEMIPVELPGDACTIAQAGFSSFEEYIDASCSYIKSNIKEGEKVVLFGHSFGGYLVHEIAAAMPECIGGVVASCCQPFHIYKEPEKGDSTYLEHFGYSDNMPAELIDLFEPLVADKIKVASCYCKEYKNGKARRMLHIPSEIIYAMFDEQECGSEEWYSYYDKENCVITCMDGGHFYWRDSNENSRKLIDVLRKMIRRVSIEKGNSTACWENSRG